MKNLTHVSLLLFLLAPLCDSQEHKSMMLTSDSFKEGEFIPKEFTCEGENYSPSLSFKNIPKKTKTLALIMEDPDAPHGTFIHWVLWNINPQEKNLKKNIPATTQTNPSQGFNSFDKVGYSGPCPPFGVHRYIFKLYALDISLKLDSYTKKADLITAMEGHVLGVAELMGKYKSAR